MSAVSEEDVLAALLLEWLLNESERMAEAWDGVGELLDVPDDFDLPPVVDAVVYELISDLELEQAIADSERRLEVERAERCVLAMAECWADESSNPGDSVYHLGEAVRALQAAKAAGGGA